MGNKAAYGWNIASNICRNEWVIVYQFPEHCAKQTMAIELVWHPTLDMWAKMSL